jgi:putative oxidoreductase
MNLGLLVLRLVVGVLFVGHGAQKLFGAFGGHGVDGTGDVFESLGLRPGRAMAVSAGLAEFVGGLLLAAGLVTPVAALVLTATMVTAIWTVHAAKGLWAANGGYEYNLTLIAAVFAITAIGPGAWSLDHVLGVAWAGADWALGALGLALVGSAATVLAGRHGAKATRRQPTATSA